MRGFEVAVLCNGFIRRDGKMVLEAHSSSTLVRTQGHSVVVDTSSSEYRPRIVERMKEIGVDPGQIDVVINTHNHIDHMENNDLFPRARVISGPLGKGKDPLNLFPGVRVVGTPGHTPESISVFVEAEKRYAIVGDAIPTHNNYLKWVIPSAHYDAELALRSMEQIAKFAEIIIPGHDAPFHCDR
jgi:glyoxylase-like metal-dependent hydrolase (beta-lactamase superfamily II)